MHFKQLFHFFFLFTTVYSLNSFALNTPNMSANVLFLYRNSNFHQDDLNVTSIDQKPNGIDVQEAELQFYSDVDPYTRLSLLLSISPHYAPDSTNTKVAQEWGIDPEEAFAESNVVPNLTFKIGKFKAAMGKHNTMHIHAYPFIEAPLANVKLLGEEGLNDAGVSARFSTNSISCTEYKL